MKYRDNAKVYFRFPKFSVSSKALKNTKLILLQDKKSRNTDNAKQFAAKIADEEKTRGSRFRNAQ